MQLRGLLTGGPSSWKYKLTQPTQPQQRAVEGLTQKLALFRACNIHLWGQTAQILFTPLRHQYPLFYSV